MDADLANVVKLLDLERRGSTVGQTCRHNETDVVMYLDRRGDAAGLACRHIWADGATQ